MSTNKKQNPIISVDGSIKQDAYVNYNGNGGQAKFTDAVNSAMPSYNGISRGFYQDTFQSVRPGISGRPEMTREDYESFRPGEALPRKYKQIVTACDNLYYNFELVRNVIDLMSDFGCQGIRFVHPVKSQERFYNAWFKKVNGFDRSERFLSGLYRHAMVVCEAQTGHLNIKVEREFYSQAEETEPSFVKSKEIPLKYTFHPPGIVRPKNNINASKVLYEMDVPDNKNNNTNPDMAGLLFTGKTRDLPLEKTFVYYFKKDDWQVKPIPFLFPLIQSAIMIKKLALADSAALDGAISAVRIFKLGNLEHKIAPTAGAVSRLDEILQSNVAAGTLDIIWGPDIELVESKTSVHQFLGQEKYAPHLQRLYEGLGIPPTLSGSGGTGTTNNYVSLKVLMNRLEYGRTMLLQFWDEQVRLVQKAMGFARPAKIEFDFLNLGDEASEKALLIQLADRNLISDEKLQHQFGYDSEMEKTRLNRENRERRSGRRVSKRSGISDDIQTALKKIALQKGFLTPEQLGVEIEKDTEKQKTPFDKQLDIQKQKAVAPVGKTATKPKGRPSTSKDSTKRKTKTFKPKIKAALELWAADAQAKVNNIVKEQFLSLVGKKNMRQLTQAEIKQYAKITFGTFQNISPFQKIDKASVVVALEKPMSKTLYDEFIDYQNGVKQEMKRDLTLDETKKVELFIYSSRFEEQLDGSC